MRKIFCAATLAVMALGTAYASDNALKDLQSSVSPSMLDNMRLPAASAAAAKTAPKPAVAEAPATDAIDSSIVNMLFQIHQTKLDPADLKKLPAALVCKDGTRISGISSGKAVLGTGSGPNDYGFDFFADTNKVSVLFNWSDGDQVGGLYVLKSDLEALAANTKASIPAKTLSGFDWADGDHYKLTDTVCSLPK